jgi:hypothetical protein
VYRAAAGVGQQLALEVVDQLHEVLKNLSGSREWDKAGSAVRQSVLVDSRNGHNCEKRVKLLSRRGRTLHAQSRGHPSRRVVL